MSSPQSITEPILNSPFVEPTRYHKFSDDGITDEVIEGRRPSNYWVAVPKPKRSKPLQRSLYELEESAEKVQLTKLVNELRPVVKEWREAGYPIVSSTTSRLLDYWNHPDRTRKLFFCQIEAVEIAIFLTEADSRYLEKVKVDGDTLGEYLKHQNAENSDSLYRVALKMATGTGKTVVMAMLIAWQALNHIAQPKSKRYSSNFLIVTPGITILDRLRVLQPNDPENYYKQRDILTDDQLTLLQRTRIKIVNYHQLALRERGQEASATTRSILAGGRKKPDAPSPFKETSVDMAKRVLGSLRGMSNLVVINDEAHHCYRRKPNADNEVLSREERREADQRNEEARLWISGLEMIEQVCGVRTIYDLSATPFFLRGSGHAEGTLFPWVVSDFSLVDAIESGIVKVPRIPMTGFVEGDDLPLYLNLYQHVKDDLPKQGKKSGDPQVEPQVPAKVQHALELLYENYQKDFAAWQKRKVMGDASTPPVLIVVCNNTTVSKMLFDHIAGWEKPSGDGKTWVQAGKLDLFRNDDNNGGWLHRPNTILVDSVQLESGEAMSSEFKAAAAREIAEFKSDYRRRNDGRGGEEISDEALLREVMNTVGKPGKLGEQIRCVVSVSMLTEGWDANTVTHILGLRAFSTQLLCEQVVGRALRRTDYTPNTEGKFPIEYAEVFGVPFSFIPAVASAPDPPPRLPLTHVRALADRADRAITFPRVIGYRTAIDDAPLIPEFSDRHRLVLTQRDFPIEVTAQGIIGADEKFAPDDLRRVRKKTVAFRLADNIMQRKASDGGGHDRPWLFPQVLRIVERWLDEYVVLNDDTFLSLLLYVEKANEAADKIWSAIVKGTPAASKVLPVMFATPEGTTDHVNFETSRTTQLTNADRCHVSHVVLDSGWEGIVTEALENHPKVHSHVINKGLEFTIPYTINNHPHKYYPDFIVRFDDGRGKDDLLNLIVEVKGQKEMDDQIKTMTISDFWLPAINNLRTWGRWNYVVVDDPWNAANTIRTALASLAASNAYQPLATERAH